MAVGSNGRRGPLALALLAGLVLGLTIGLVAFLVASPDAAPAAGAPRDADRSARSVILIVGDGMGAAHREAARLDQHGRDGALLMDSMPVVGFQSTSSADPDDVVTDSAAAATAWATGQRTYNGAVSVDLDGAPAAHPRRPGDRGRPRHRSGHDVAGHRRHPGRLLQQRPRPRPAGRDRPAVRRGHPARRRPRRRRRPLVGGSGRGRGAGGLHARHRRRRARRRRRRPAARAVRRRGDVRRRARRPARRHGRRGPRRALRAIPTASSSSSRRRRSTR